MKWQGTMQPSQMEKFAGFLEEHPGFSPELISEEAVVCGFHLGESFLTVREMGKLAGSQGSQCPNRKQEEVAVQEASKAAKSTTVGPFLTIMLALAQQRSRTEALASSEAATAERPISAVAIATAMEKVSRQTQPAHKDALALGPFLGMILTLTKRKVANQGYALRSSILPAGPGHFVLAGGR
jgi:hypothetical protein